MSSIPSGRTAVLISAALLVSAVLSAQQTPPQAATPVPQVAVVLPTSAADTFEVIITSRAKDTVRAEKDRLLGERRDAESRWTTLRDSASRLKGNVSEVKSAINEAGNREKQAKKEKRDADRIVALADKRRLERSLDILEARYNLRQAQVEQSKQQRDFLDAAIRADDAELAIAERREQVLPDDPTQRSAFQELTNRWLQALRTRAARSYDVEDRRFKVVEAQLELLKRQRG
jgi:chromosome segregation ATPase